MDQETLDDIAQNLGVEYKVHDNLKDGKHIYRASITLTNGSSHVLKHGNWAIYLCHIRMIEPGTLPSSEGCPMVAYGVHFSHINGCLFKLTSLKEFKPMKKGDKLEIHFKAKYFSVARSDLMPNWYMTADKLKPCLISSTVGEDMTFVQKFDTAAAWKRFDYTLENGSKRFDHYDPYTPTKRLERNEVNDLGKPGQIVIPTPLSVKLSEDSFVNIREGKWEIYAPKELSNEAKYLSDKLSLPVKETGTPPDTGGIVLAAGAVAGSAGDQQQETDEWYSLQIKSGSVHIIGRGVAGVFYGIQTFHSLLMDDGRLPVCEVQDGPRYNYRGMHLDVSRNFHKKEQVLKLLEVMATYKMNKFHFHLTDDEGWRLEIPGLEELTAVGSRRGHSTNSDNSCLLPLLGSGPNFDTSGSGYYTVEDYQEILQFAKERHIEVIPEIDMPGHSHAAIRAMKARYSAYKAKKDMKKAKEYILTDLEDSSDFCSVQMFSDNAMNPGLESTYRFIEKIVTAVKELHEGISPLQTFHLGGDEVPYESWEGSPACQKLVDTRQVKSFDELMEYFVTRVAGIVAKHGLNLGAWQDGVIYDEVDLSPMKRKSFDNKEVLVYAWQNVWESGLAGCAYKLANAGYKVVMSQGTHLYFDHPYEPDPEERGLYWAARFIDTQKTFGFMPDNLYANLDFKLTGEKLPDDFIKTHKKDHASLKKPENVIGVQGHLWSELVRTSDQMDSMIFPRLIAVAERGWHKAPWESLKAADSLNKGKQAAWEIFANSLGYKELPRLDALNVAYHIPPPGARYTDGKLEMHSAFPGLPMFYSSDGGVTWSQYTGKVEITLSSDIQLMTKSKDERRSSRIVTMKKTT